MERGSLLRLFAALADEGVEYVPLPDAVEVSDPAGADQAGPGRTT